MSSGRSGQHRAEDVLEQRLGKRCVVREIGERDLGSIIQNSARCRLVFEFSARNVGPNV
jgi:hypothetical protein